jgi:dipeptidyl aminopeptidase/acylaminoacyl peptidase
VATLLWCAAVTATPPARSEFLERQTISAVTLSPGGDQVAWLAEEGARRAVWLSAADGASASRAMSHTPASELAYTRDGRWLLLATTSQIFALAVAGQPGSGLLAKLDENSDWRIDHTQDAAIAIIDKTDSVWRLRRIPIGAAPMVLHTDTHRIAGYAFDAEGHLRWLQRVEDDRLVVHERPADGRAERPLLSCGRLESCTPLFDDAGQLVLQSNTLRGDPSGLSRLLRWPARGDAMELARDPRGEADLDFVAIDSSGRPRIAGYRSTVPQIQAIEARDDSAVAFLRKRFEGSNLRLQIGERRWLIEERHGARRFARWYWFDPIALRVDSLFDEAEQPQPGFAQRHFRWAASDGMNLHGFITVPAGDARRLPLVVLAHGGPWSHWQPQYNAMAQFIASRGAIVFEPNHRGSTGHGLRYLTAANGDFGNGRVQRDIDDGVRALLESGVGDSQRVAIVGASFGGYAALLGATFEPDLYRAAVAFVPPPDFAWTLQWILRNTESLALDGLVPMQTWLRLLNLDVDDRAQMARLREQSPLANLARLRRPVLVVAGGSDERVGIAGIIEYAARAKLAQKDVTVLIDPIAGHRQRNDLAREANLYLVESMLHRYLGTVEPAPADQPLRDYIRSMRASPTEHRFALDGGSRHRAGSAESACAASEKLSERSHNAACRGDDD